MLFFRSKNLWKILRMTLKYDVGNYIRRRLYWGILERRCRENPLLEYCKKR